MIYFIQAADGSDTRIKIGTTIRLSERLKQLCREMGTELRVLAVAEGNRDQEQALHRRFAHLYAVNEWFEPGDDLLGFIVQECRPWDGSDEVPKPSDDRASIVLIAGSTAYKEWIAALAAFVRLSRIDIIDQALVDYAKKVGFSDPPPKQ